MDRPHAGETSDHGLQGRNHSTGKSESLPSWVQLDGGGWIWIRQEQT